MSGVRELGRERFEREFILGIRLDRGLIGGDGLLGSIVVGVQAAEASSNLDLLFGGNEFGEAFEVCDELSILSELLAQTRRSREGLAISRADFDPPLDPAQRRLGFVARFEAGHQFTHEKRDPVSVERDRGFGLVGANHRIFVTGRGCQVLQTPKGGHGIGLHGEYRFQDLRGLFGCIELIAQQGREGAEVAGSLVG